MANETWKFVQAKSKQAMKQVLGIKDEAARMKVTPPLAVAPLAHGDDMRWNPNDDGINFNPSASARSSIVPTCSASDDGAGTASTGNRSRRGCSTRPSAREIKSKSVHSYKR